MVGKRGWQQPDTMAMATEISKIKPKWHVNATAGNGLKHSCRMIWYDFSSITFWMSNNVLRPTQCTAVSCDFFFHENLWAHWTVISRDIVQIAYTTCTLLHQPTPQNHFNDLVQQVWSHSVTSQTFTSCFNDLGFCFSYIKYHKERLTWPTVGLLGELRLLYLEGLQRSKIAIDT